MFYNQIIMTIFIKESARHTQYEISLKNTQKMFFDMCNITTKEPVLQRNGVKNSVTFSLLIT
jgi:hypothetical protein